MQEKRINLSDIVYKHTRTAKQNHIRVGLKSNQIKPNLLKAEGPSWSLTLP